jgi:hypothetical protein
MEVEVAEKRAHFLDDLTAGCLHKSFNNRARNFGTPNTNKLSVTSPDVTRLVSPGMLIEHQLHSFLKAFIPVPDNLIQEYPEKRLQIIRNFMRPGPRIQQTCY